MNKIDYEQRHPECPIGKNGAIVACTITGRFTKKLCPTVARFCPNTQEDKFDNDVTCVAAEWIECPVRSECPIDDECDALMFSCRMIPAKQEWADKHNVDRIEALRQRRGNREVF